MRGKFDLPRPLRRPGSLRGDGRSHRCLVDSRSLSRSTAQVLEVEPRWLVTMTRLAKTKVGAASAVEARASAG